MDYTLELEEIKGVQMLILHSTCYPTQIEGLIGGSFIAERSCHNQRIEILWRDVYCGCSFIFHILFTYMESEGLLDIGNDVHMYALRYTVKDWPMPHRIHSGMEQPPSVY